MNAWASASRSACSPGVARVIGRLGDLERRNLRAGEVTLPGALARWSFADNHDWLAEGVRRGDPFLQISTVVPGTLLAWEIEQLQAMGCVRVGPFWLPTAWWCDPECYRRVVRLIAARVQELPNDGDAVFVPKALAELEPLLAMWPFVVALPTTAALSLDELILARAWPIHPLGIVTQPARADGRWCSPAEYFCHDVDHARFKVREDLAARGILIPDAYVGGSTFDALRGEHRTILPAALPHVGDDRWRTAPARAALACGWLGAIARERQRDLATAAKWLLFELVHEKSLPLDRAVLTAALATSAHVAKLETKCAAGFHAPHGPPAAAVARLADARLWLQQLIARTE
jgi:hypothetical protein